jgi:hypothetical protein
MSDLAGQAREIAVPVSVFGTLRSELAKEAGMLPTVHALHHAGYRAGLAAAKAVDGESGGQALSLGHRDFWSQVGGYFQRRGWGTLAHHAPHPAVGILSSSDWAEATGSDPQPDSSCSFSTGFLSGLLSQLAGGPVAVLEVGCRSRGGDSCQFAFGSEGAIHELYGRLLEGVDLDVALEEL